MELVARLRPLAAAHGRKALVVTASLLLVLLIGYTLAAFVWLAVDGVPVAATPVAPSGATVAMPRRQLTPDMAGQWTLFGDAAAQPVAAGDKSAPDTNLSLQLLGTFSTGDVRLAGAVIAERGKDGDLFRVGSSVPGGATLEKVEKDRVLLRRRGQLETLRFDEAPVADGGQVPVPGGAAGIAAGFRGLKDRLSRPPQDDGTDAGGSGASPSRVAIDQYVDDIKANPEGVLKDLGLKPAGNGAGYLVGDGASAEVIRNLGLRPGDVVLSVNGKPLGNIQGDARMVDEVKASGEARIEIKRGSQTFTVNYPL